MMNRSGFMLKALATVTAVAILAGCSGGKAKDTPAAQPPAPAPSTKKLDVSLAMWSAPNNFNPLNTDSSYGFTAIEIMFDSLVGTNDKGDYVPKLAEKWDVSPDFTTFTFHINPKANWHDGQPVTAKDIAYTINIISNKETATNRASQISLLVGTDADGKSANGTVDGVKVIDNKTVQFITKKPVDPISVMEKIGTNIRFVPEHILKDTAPKDLAAHKMWREPTVGNGAFKFVKYATDQYIEYARNDNYYLGKPKLERLFLRIMPATTAVAALEKGEIDLTAGAGIGEIPISDWDKVQKLTNVNAVTFVSKGYQYMEFNHKQAFFKDPKVRQAFYYGVNRKLIVDTLLKGNGLALEGPYTPLYKYVNSTLKVREFDPVKAKQLLTEGGWDFNRELSLLVPTGNKVREQSGDIIVANLQQAGVKVKIQKMDFATMQARRKTGDYDMSLVGWSDILDPDVSSQYRTGGVYNNGKYSNPKVDELMDLGIVTPEYNARKKVYDEFQSVIYNDPAAVILYSPNALVAVSKRMVNVKMAATGAFWNLQDWDVTQ
jgi:peptide/nickel transport system substrate-binding protein